MVKKYAILCTLFALAACHSTPPLPGMKLGKPYEVNGTTYYPEHQPTYDKTGDGSWYGPGFDGKKTASGEIFDQDDITAAHPTLPMPSLVRVTNLRNGKSAIVRINDRGPFKSHRIIDLSKGAAQRIGLHSTMPVRVQYLKAETEAYLESVRNGTAPVDMHAYNDNPPEMAPVLTEADIIQADNAEPAAYSEVDTQTLAPLSSIESSDLDRPAAPVRKLSLVKDAQAEEKIIMPNPVKATPVAAKTTVQNLTTKKPEAKSAGKQPEAVQEHYIIFAGSYASQENAHKLEKKLKEARGLKIAVAVDKVAANGKSLWRVHAGPFDGKYDAEQALAIVHKSGAPDARVVKEN